MVLAGGLLPDDEVLLLGLLPPPPQADSMAEASTVNTNLLVRVFKVFSFWNRSFYRYCSAPLAGISV
jgi:hypothetical protein